MWVETAEDASQFRSCGCRVVGRQGIQRRAQTVQGVRDRQLHVLVGRAPASGEQPVDDRLVPSHHDIGLQLARRLVLPVTGGRVARLARAQPSHDGCGEGCLILTPGGEGAAQFGDDASRALKQGAYIGYGSGIQSASRQHLVGLLDVAERGSSGRGQQLCQLSLCGLRWHLLDRGRPGCLWYRGQCPHQLTGDDGTGKHQGGDPGQHRLMATPEPHPGRSDLVSGKRSPGRSARSPVHPAG